MTRKMISRVLLVAGMTTALAAGGCDGGTNAGGGGGTLQDGFGRQFAAFFNAADTAAPGDPAAGDIVPPDATADPVDF